MRPALIETSEAFRHLADAMPFLLWSTDSDGSLEYANRPFFDYVGQSPRDLAGGEWISVVHPDDVELCLAGWEKAVAAGQRHSVEFRIRRFDGCYRWHQVSSAPIRGDDGSIVKWYRTANDVDDHKLREEELERISDRLRSTLESITTAFYTVDFQWRITYLNAEFEAWLNRPGQAIIGVSIWDLFPHLVGTTIDEEFHRALRETRAVKFIQHFPLVGKWVEVHAYPWSEGLSVYLHDVTAERAMEEKLQQAQRLEAVGQLTGGIAHDFNNLLTVILGNAEILAENLAENEDLRSVAELTLDSAERGAELTRRLLSFARQMPLEPRTTDVEKLVLGMDGLLRRSLGEHVEIEVIGQGQIPTTLVDAPQLEHAILNLCINSRDAMPGGGKLTIETSEAVFDADGINIDDENLAGHYVMIAVSDTGSGMPPEIVARVFEPFFTTKAVGEGSGLGLSMVYGFIRQSNGHVKIYSHPGEGTTVKLYLPASVGAVDSVETSPPDEEIPTGSERILVVEDEDIVREHVSAQLRRLGYDVVTAGSGPEALDVLERDGRFDLLFTDVVMPGGMSGRDLAERAGIMCPEMPVLFTSGYTENAFIRNGRLEAGVHLLSKPYRRRELAHKLRSVLDGTSPDAG